MKLAPEWHEIGPHYAAEWERRDTDAALSEVIKRPFRNDHETIGCKFNR